MYLLLLLYRLQQDPFLPETTTGPGVTESTTQGTTRPGIFNGGLSAPKGTNPLVDPANFEFMELINKLIAYAFLLVFALSVAFIFWGGISFILSGGQEEKVKSAVNTIRYAIIGLLVAIFSFAIVAWIGGQFDLDLIRYIRPDNIIGTISDLVSGK